MHLLNMMLLLLLLVLNIILTSRKKSRLMSLSLHWIINMWCLSYGRIVACNVWLVLHLLMVHMIVLIFVDNLAIFIESFIVMHDSWLLRLLLLIMLTSIWLLLGDFLKHAFEVITRHWAWRWIRIVVEWIRSQLLHRLKLVLSMPIIEWLLLSVILVLLLIHILLVLLSLLIIVLDIRVIHDHWIHWSTIIIACIHHVWSFCREWIIGLLNFTSIEKLLRIFKSCLIWSSLRLISFRVFIIIPFIIAIARAVCNYVISLALLATSWVHKLVLFRLLLIVLLHLLLLLLLLHFLKSFRVKHELVLVTSASIWEHLSAENWVGMWIYGGNLVFLVSVSMVCVIDHWITVLYWENVLLIWVLTLISIVILVVLVWDLLLTLTIMFTSWCRDFSLMNNRVKLLLLLSIVVIRLLILWLCMVLLSWLDHHIIVLSLLTFTDETLLCSTYIVIVRMILTTMVTCHNACLWLLHKLLVLFINKLVHKRWVKKIFT